MPNMLPEDSGEITPERMKGWNQSKSDTQLWKGMVIEENSNAIEETYGDQGGNIA